MLEVEFILFSIPPTYVEFILNLENVVLYAHKLTFVPIYYYCLVNGLDRTFIYPKWIALIYLETLTNYLGNGKYIHLMSQIYFLDSPPPPSFFLHDRNSNLA